MPAAVAESGAYPAELYGSYIVVATLGMFVWDILTNLGDEYHLILKPRRFGFPVVVYVLYRLIAVAGMIGAFLVFATPIGRFCTGITRAILIGFPVGILLHNLSLFFRLRAVYMDKQNVVRAYFIALLVVTGCSTLIPFAGEAHQIGPANPYCTASANVVLTKVMLIIPLLNQLGIFFAISWRLIPRHILEETSKSHSWLWKIRVIIKGKHLPSLTKTMFIDGQWYIVVFLISTIITSMIIALGRLPNIYCLVLIAPHAAIEHCMNSYLFRNVRVTAMSNAIEPAINIRTTVYSNPGLPIIRHYV